MIWIITYWQLLCLSWPPIWLITYWQLLFQSWSLIWLITYWQLLFQSWPPMWLITYWQLLFQSWPPIWLITYWQLLVQSWLLIWLITYWQLLFLSWPLIICVTVSWKNITLRQAEGRETAYGRDFPNFGTCWECGGGQLLPAVCGGIQGNNICHCGWWLFCFCKHCNILLQHPFSCHCSCFFSCPCLVSVQKCTFFSFLVVMVGSCFHCEYLNSHILKCSRFFFFFGSNLYDNSV